jgi:hypothetical protein
MTQEHKDILIKDLCARLPYGVKAEKYTIRIDGEVVPLKEAEVVTAKDILSREDCPGYMIRPYLFPLSSMTEEQKREFDISMDMGYAAAYNAEINCANRMIDFFHKHHIDYRGLIPMGLAIDATNKDIY